MKAYYVSIRNDEDQGGGIVFANTVQEARKQYGRFDLDPESWLDVQAHRNKKYDDLENLPEAQLYLRCWRDGWHWFGGEPCRDTATDDEFIEWYNNMFGKEATNA